MIFRRLALNRVALDGAGGSHMRDMIRNILRLFAGNAGAQVLSVLAAPLLTRLYTPAEIGVYAFFTAATPSLLAIASLRYDLAVTFARSDEEAGNVLVAAFAAMVFTVTLLTAGILLLPVSIKHHIAPVEPYLLFLPIVMVCAGANTLLANEAMRMLRYSEMAWMRFYQAIFGPVVQVTLGALGSGTIGLIIGFIVQLGAGTYGLGRRVLAGPRSPLKFATLAGARAAAIRYKDFPLYSVATALVSAWTGSLVNLTFTLFYGPEVGGLVFLGERVIGRPLSLIFLSIVPVMSGESAKLARENPAALPATLVGVLWRQFAIVAVIVACATASAPYLVPIVFGAKWSAAVIYLEYRSIAIAFAGVTGIALSLVQSLGRQRVVSILVLTRLVILVSVLGGTLELGWKPPNAVLAFSLTDAVLQCTCLALSYREICHISRDRLSQNAQEKAALAAAEFLRDRPAAS